MSANESKSKPEPESTKSESQPSAGPKHPLDAIIGKLLSHYKIRSVVLATALRTANSAASRFVDRNLRGVLGDAGNMHRYLLDLKTNPHIGIELHSVYCNSVIQREHEGKDNMMEQLNRLFNVEAFSDVLFIIYYAGHGCRESRGDWAIAKPFHGRAEESPGYDVITLEEILKLWKERRGKTFGKGSSLLILSDCGHSGAWVEQLQPKKNMEDFKKVSMVASCGPEEISREDDDGGDFTKYLLRGKIPHFRPRCTQDITLQGYPEA